MVDLSREQFEAAAKWREAERAQEPRAIAASYDQRLGRVVVEIANGCIFAFPPCLAQGLEKASDAQLAQVEILGAGSGLHWEDLDVDLSIPGLMAGVFGNASHMARQAGLATSPAKAGSRANVAQGGPARKIAQP